MRRSAVKKLVPGWQPHPDEGFTERLSAELARWEGTPYMTGQRCPGKFGGVDCVHFVVAMLDAMTGRTTKVDKIPADACFHAEDVARAAADKVRAMYEPTVDVNPNKESLQPGDVVIVGPQNGGPGHAMIVGARRNEVWHANRPFVCRTGITGIYMLGYRVFGCYRLVIQ